MSKCCCSFFSVVSRYNEVTSRMKVPSLYPIFVISVCADKIINILGLCEINTNVVPPTGQPQARILTVHQRLARPMCGTSTTLNYKRASHRH